VNEFIPECFTCHNPVKEHYYQLAWKSVERVVGERERPQRVSIGFIHK